MNNNFNKPKKIKPCKISIDFDIEKFKKEWLRNYKEEEIKFFMRQKDLDPEFNDIVNENFNELLDD